MTATIKFILNNRQIETAVSPGSGALDFIRSQYQLVGTKEGCREGECGACTVLLGCLNQGKMQYQAVASCLLPLGELEGKHVVTVEGINPVSALTPVQQALTNEGASQCGFCTPGFVMALTGFFLTSPNLDYQDAIDAMDGNICRCTGYLPIQRAARILCDLYHSKLEAGNRVSQLVAWGILPDYFLTIGDRLKKEMIKKGKKGGSQENEPLIEGAVLVAGGTDLFVQRPAELAKQKIALISQLPGLKGIKKEAHAGGERIAMGAATTVEEMRLSPLINEFFPRMKEYLDLVSSTIMRNSATLAGNIVNASPIGDLSIILLALDASLLIASPSQKTREIPLKEFFLGYKEMDLKTGEIITRIFFNVPLSESCFHFEKVSQRKYLDIASCNTAIQIHSDGHTIRHIHLSAGGVSPVPLYLSQTSNYFKGKPINAQTIAAAIAIMKEEISPISDVRGTVEYKTRLLQNLIYAHFITLFPGKIADESIPGFPGERNVQEVVS